MPPYATALSDAEIAAVLTMIRSELGQQRGPINTVDVQRYRGGG